MLEIEIPRTMVNKMLSMAQQSPEDEVCALISVDQQNREQLYPIDNIANDTHKLFQMDPQQQIHAMKAMRENNESLFAIMHSHPHAPAYPSVEDLEQAAYPEANYIIVSLNTEGVLEMRGFRLSQEQVEDLAIHVVESN